MKWLIYFVLLILLAGFLRASFGPGDDRAPDDEPEEGDDK